MTIELPDLEATAGVLSSEARLERACARHGRGRVGKVAGAELAGVDFFSFQRALGERGLLGVTKSMLTSELASLKAIFPK